VKRGLAILAAALLLVLPVRAVEFNTAFGADEVAEALPEGAAELMEGAEITDPDPQGFFQRMGDFLRARLAETLREVLRPLLGMMAVVLLAGMGDSLVQGAEGFDAVGFGSCLAIAVIGAEDVRSVVRLGTETLAELGDFSRVLLPTLTSAAAASGTPGRAAAAYAASALFSDLLLSGANRLLLPLICASVAVSAAAAALGDKRLDSAVQLLQWGGKTLLKGFVFAFTAYLGLTGVLASAADAAAVKAAKSAISAALPVVGKLLSDASEALVAGAGLLRSAIGVYGMLACLAAVLLPALRLGLRYLLFRAAAILCGGIAGERQSRLIDRLGGAYGLLLGLVGSASAVAFLSVISLIRTVSL